ncbi:MAG: regulatory protein RecX [Flavobacteriaceae bacterium]
MKSTSYTYDEALAKLEHYCAYQERCHMEVEQKLQSLGMIPQLRQTIITQLIQDNFLNETRFSQAFTRGKFRIKKWGKLRIKRELKVRQISDWNINNALKEISPEDYQLTLHELCEQFWYKHAKLDPWKRGQKVMQALRYRGWETDLIIEALNSLRSDS